MNRKIKFRAFSQGKMIYEKDISHIMLEDTPIYRMAKYWCNIPPDAKVMQFTGLCDKNGTEIYEGDIVKIKSFNPYQVVWGKYDSGWNLVNAKGEGDEYGLYTRNISLNEDKEVIGNIHEHPHLIEQ